MLTQSKILTVDDNPNNLRLLVRILAKRGYDISTAESGPEAISHIEHDLPDLILLDIQMPEMNGYQVCEHLKAEARTQDVPVIFLSALGDTGDKVKGFAAGAVDYITKPFDIHEVVARVNTHLTIRSLQKDLEAQNLQLKAALDQVKTLQGLLPICSHCKNIRNDDGYWEQVESYFSHHSGADFSHTICPDCFQEHYPEYYREKK